MPVIRTVHISDKVKVAAIFDVDKVEPVWFQLAGQKPVVIDQISAVWYTTRASAQVTNFEISASGERYCLTFDSGTLNWGLGKTIID